MYNCFPTIKQVVFIEKCLKAIETKAGKTVSSGIEFENMPKRIIDKYDDFLNKMPDFKKIVDENNRRVYRINNIKDCDYIKYRCRNLTITITGNNIRMNVNR